MQRKSKKKKTKRFQGLELSEFNYFLRFVFFEREYVSPKWVRQTVSVISGKFYSEFIRLI